MVEIFSIFSPNGHLVKLERIRVLTTRVEPLASRLVLVMIRVPVEAFLAITYIRLTLRGSYTGVSIYSPNRCISYIIFIRSISIIYGLIVDPHNDQLSVGLIAQVKWSTAPASQRSRFESTFKPFSLLLHAKNCEHYIHSFQSVVQISAFHVLTSYR